MIEHICKNCKFSIPSCIGNICSQPNRDCRIYYEDRFEPKEEKKEQISGTAKEMSMWKMCAGCAWEGEGKIPDICATCERLGERSDNYESTNDMGKKECGGLSMDLKCSKCGEIIACGAYKLSGTIPISAKFTLDGIVCENCQTPEKKECQHSNPICSCGREMIRMKTEDNQFMWICDLKNPIRFISKEPSKECQHEYPAGDFIAKECRLCGKVVRTSRKDEEEKKEWSEVPNSGGLYSGKSPTKEPSPVIPKRISQEEINNMNGYFQPYMAIVLNKIIDYLTYLDKRIEKQAKAIREAMLGKIK